MQVERMTERSAQRALDRLLRRVDTKNAVERAIRAVIVRGLGPVIGGVLFPRDVAPGTIFTPEELERERAKQLKPIGVPENVRRISNIPDTRGTPLPRELREIDTPNRQQRIGVASVPAFERRNPIPVRRATTRVARSGTGSRTASGKRFKFATPTAIASALISQLIQSRSSRPIPFRDPIQPPLGRPFVPTTPGPTTQPLPTRTRTPQFDDLCRERARQQRKKRRKCEQRANVVWAGGPNKGKIAGTKCFKFGN
jgi:hypothetical protein